MRANEPVDVMKWAIALFLFALVVGATVYLFYFLYDTSDSRIDSMQKATTSSTTERLFELQDKYHASSGDWQKYPLVTTVANTLREYDEDSLLYITITTPDGSTSIYKYDDGINLNADNSITQVISDVPVMEAVKYLLQYSDCRTEILLGEYDPNGGGGYTAYTGTGWMYVQLILHEASIAH